MAGSVSDEAFARYVNQIGNATLDQLDAAKAVQAEEARKGVSLALGDVLVRQGILTPAIRENLEKKLLLEQQGGMRQLGPYKLLKKLGEGGMGAVYLAEDTNMGRKVALKILPKKHAGDSEFLSRFRREARASGQLNHVNIVCAYSTGEEMGHHFIVMEYCEGESLDQILKRGSAGVPAREAGTEARPTEHRLPWDQAVEIVMQVARGLKHAHEHGIIHRDIKPANIILCAPLGDGPRVAKILDMGLSKQLGGEEQTFHTGTGVALGTPHYLSPEQAEGKKDIDGRTDIYSLGATFYHLVTGQTPFQGSTAAVIMLKHLSEKLVNPQDLVEDLPDGVAHVIMRMMAREPKDRYGDCKELLDDLALVIDGKNPSSAAIDQGKSSVAVARVARPKRTGVAAAGPRRTARPAAPVGTREHAPVTRPSDPARSRRDPEDRATTPVGKYIGIGVAVLGALIFIVALAMSGGGDKSETRSSKSEGNSKNETEKKQPALSADSGTKSAAQAAEEARLKGMAAKLEAEKQKFEADKRKAEEERKAAEAARLAAEAEAKKKAAIAATQVVSPPVQPDTKVTQPDTKAGETPAARTAGVPPAAVEADARAAKAQQAFSAVLKECAPLLAQTKYADALALLERKAKDPALADAAELLKQEKADVEAVVELRRSAVEAIRKLVGKQVTLKKGSGTISGKVVDDAKRDGITLNVGGPEMTVRADQIHVDDIDQYAPRTGSQQQTEAARGTQTDDLRRRGLLYLYAGNVPKAKEYLGKAVAQFAKLRDAGLPDADQQFGKLLDSYLDRITALELGEIEAAALKAWERAEKLFAAKDMKNAKAAYEAFEREHGKTQAAVSRAATVRERYDAIEKVLGPMPELTLNLGGGVKMEFVLVKAGEFDMGSKDEGGGEEKPVHKVKISKPYYIGKFDVTVAQFRRFAETAKYETECERGGNKGWTVKDGKWQGDVAGINWKQPGFEQTAEHPVVLVTWNDAQAFTAWLSKLSGRDIRLPTEAQWEYAARGPKSLKYPWSDKWEGTKANHGDVSLKNTGFTQWGCTGDNDGFAHTSPAGTYKSGASWCGAYDMSGNVWQWCADWFSDKYYQESPPVDPKGPATGGERVLRGGSWDTNPDHCRAARRHRSPPGDRNTSVGFRCALDF